MMKKTPRYYQVDFTRAVLAAWEKHRKVVGVLPTSGGKTICAAMLFDEIVSAGGRPLFCGDTNELVSQPLIKISDFTGLYPGLEKAETRAPLAADCVVGSLQTMGKGARLERFPRDHFTHLFFDEAHRNVLVHQRVCEYFESAKVLGITATDFRTNMKDLSAYYEYVAYRMETFDMVDAGFIPPIKVMTLPIDIDLSHVKQTRSVEGSDYDKTEMAEAIKPYFVAIARAIRENLGGRKIVVFLPLCNSSRDFAQICREHGISARHVDGESADREQILASYDRGDFQLISNSNLLTTGWDCHIADTLINLRQTRSVGLFRQMVGRVVRVLPNTIDHIPEEWQAQERREAIASSAKPHGLIVDLLWQTEKFGLAGPSSLIANNPEDAEGMGAKMKQARLPVDIQGVSKEYQEEQESKLITQLRRAAKRSVQIYDARAIGKLLGEQGIMDFHPKNLFDTDPPTPWQKHHLRAEHIDLKTVENRGHASAILNAIFRRRGKNQATIKEMIDRLDEPPELPFTPAAAPVPQDEFLSWLTEQPGKYSGKR